MDLTFPNMNNGVSILSKQNLDVNIDKLLAQRRLYSNAKTIQCVVILITVFIPIIIAILTTFTEFKIDDKNWIFVSYTIFVLILERILENKIDRNKKIAASIQEKFDISVLSIPENETLNTVFVDYDIIRRYSRKDKQNQKKVLRVKDWYSVKIARLQTNLSTLFCQRMNICYDASIKEKYNYCLYTLSVFTFLALLCVSLANNFILQKFITEVLLPCLPLFLFVYKERSTNIESIDNLNNLRDLIERELDNSFIESNTDINTIRKIQDRIYNNRILSPLIPDTIYKILWTKLEDEMNYSVENRINNLQ